MEVFVLVIHASNLSLVYPSAKTKALDHIHFDIKQGELVFLVGESGAGKTSLFKMLLAYAYPTEGVLQIDGKNIQRTSLHEQEKLKLRKKIGPVFQDFKLFFGRSVMENVLMGLRTIKNPTNEDIDRAADILENVGLYQKLNNRVEHLSFGERQRVGIARAIVRAPQILIADEPTGNLDQKTASAIIQLLINIKDKKTTAIITTHATHLLPKGVGRLIELKDGQIIQDREL